MSKSDLKALLFTAAVLGPALGWFALAIHPGEALDRCLATGASRDSCYLRVYGR